VSPEEVEALFTRSDGSFLFARWGRAIAPVVFGVDEATLATVKGAIEAVCRAGHPSPRHRHPDPRSLRPRPAARLDRSRDGPAPRRPDRATGGLMQVIYSPTQMGEIMRVAGLPVGGGPCIWKWLVIEMKKLLASLLVIAASPAAAQDWTFQASLYGWIPGMSTSVDTSLGTVEADKSGSDALQDLDAAFMGTLEARNGRWGLIGDLIYANLSASEDTPFGSLYSDADVDVSLTAFSGYAAYRVHETPRLAFDIAGGFRAFAVNVDTTLNSAGVARDRDFDADESWAVPLVAARVIVPFDDRWFATAFADVGGLSGDNTTWQAFASVGYRFDPRWSMQFGYRYMSVAKEIGGRDVDIDLSGPLIGVSAHF
jgi:hypothetical protein